MVDQEFKRAFSLAEQEHKIVSEIVKERKQKGLTQKDLASRLGLKQQAISTFERVEESTHIPFYCMGSIPISSTKNERLVRNDEFFVLLFIYG